MRLTPYQAEWKKLYEKEATQLQTFFGKKLLCVEHVGSTAVDGMEAKPVIDMMAAVEDLGEACSLVPGLERFGYEYRGNGGVEDRIFLAKGSRTQRTHHLSLTEPNSDHWQRNLLFRDYLRAHPEIAEEYRKLKQELARKHPEDRESYTIGKIGFIEQATESARAGR